MVISSREQLEKAAIHFGMLPFFSNKIPGFSIEEMAAPGKLFAETRDDCGCWEWKGPVIQEQTTAYGKFFNRKAGFIDRKLLPDFINYRRKAYPIGEDTTEKSILEIVQAHEGITSTELKKLISNPTSRQQESFDSFDFLSIPIHSKVKRRKNIEGPLTRLQMGGWLLIADFEYKYTTRGDRYGWGVALYSTPEIWFDQSFMITERTPEESFEFLCNKLSESLPGIDRSLIENFIS